MLSRSVVSNFLEPVDCSLPGSSVHGILQARILEWGCHALLQGIFPTQGSNPGLLHCSRMLYCPSHQGSPRILEWGAYPLSRGSSWPRNWTGVSCIAAGFFTSWATREVPYLEIVSLKRDCCCSVLKSCLTLCDPMGYSTASFPILHYLLEFAKIHVLKKGKAR